MFRPCASKSWMKTRSSLKNGQYTQLIRYLSTIQLRPEHFDYKEREIITLNCENRYHGHTKTSQQQNGSILAPKKHIDSHHAPETQISTFKYDNGMEAIRVRQNKVLEMIILPYQGHQIWSLNYYRKYHSSTIPSNKTETENEKFEDYHSIGMKSMFDMPNYVNTSDQWGYLTTYGAFFIHCGILAMGAPGDNDKHGLHGEIANGRFDNNTYIDIDDENNQLIFRGIYNGQKCFDYNYKFISKHCININPYTGMTRCNDETENENNCEMDKKLSNMSIDDFRKYGNFENLVKTQVSIENYYTNELPIMYLAHINFRPELNGKLSYSASTNTTVGSEHSNNNGDSSLPDIQIRTAIPAHIKGSPEYIAFMKDCVKDIQKHETLDKNLMKLLNTELVMTLNNYHSTDHCDFDKIDAEIDFLEHAGKYLTKEEFFEKFPNYGYAASMLRLDGASCGNGDNGSYIVEHKPTQLKKCIRWMVYDPPNIEACGFALPATSNPNGRYQAHKDGEYLNVPSAKLNKETNEIEPGTLQFDLRYGYLNESMTKCLQKKIQVANENKKSQCSNAK